MQSNKKRIELQKKWWKRTNQHPLIYVYAPIEWPYGGLDINVKPREIHKRKLADADAEYSLPSDKLIVATVNFGVGLIPALAGAGFGYDKHMSWSIPVFDSIKKIKINSFSPGNPLFQKYIERLTPLLENWSYETYIPGMADYLGPMDILSGLIGQTKLSFELYDNPEVVKHYAMEAAIFLKEMVHYENDLFRKAGLNKGVTDIFRLWLPESGIRMSEDFSALVGEKHFREYFIKPVSVLTKSVNSSVMHTHSAAYRCMKGFLDIPKLSAIEFGRDPNGPSLEDRIKTVNLIQENGFPVQMSELEPLSQEEINLIINNLKPNGLLLHLTSQSLSEAWDIYKRLKAV